MDARLFTRGGEYVATVADVPAFHFPPEILAWGSRFFTRQPDGAYVEALVWGATRITFDTAVPRRGGPHETNAPA